MMAVLRQNMMPIVYILPFLSIFYTQRKEMLEKNITFAKK